jgi:hypothetical protein
MNETAVAPVAYLGVVTENPVTDGWLIRPVLFSVSKTGIDRAQKTRVRSLVQLAPTPNAMGGMNYSTMSNPTRTKSLVSPMNSMMPPVTTN